jgi:PAS domain S-box-containing protein
MEPRDSAYYRTILDAMPLMIFVVDDDVRIKDVNTAATAVFGLPKATVLNRRGGEVLHCLHSQDVPEGCGRAPFCQTCVIRNSVASSIQGQAVARRRAQVELLQGGAIKALEWLITTSPLPRNEAPLVLLILEDISEFATLKGLVPICANCKKIRDDQQYWHQVEAYFHDYMGVDFTHSLCPACVKELYPQVGQHNKKNIKR